MPIQTRSRFSPLRLIEEWEALYWEAPIEYVSDIAHTIVPKRTHVAWWLQNRIETATALWHVLTSDKPFPDDGRGLSLAQRAFLKTKTILCLLLDRDGGSLDEAGYSRRLHSIIVCEFGFQEYGTPDGPGGTCAQVHVGYGYFKHWHAFLDTESWP